MKRLSLTLCASVCMVSWSGLVGCDSAAPQQPRPQPTSLPELKLAEEPSTGVHYVARGPEGGPFEGRQASFQLTNTLPSTLRWQASTDARWLVVSSVSGTLSPDEETVVTMAIDASQAAALKVGSYDAEVRFSGVDDTSSHLGSVFWTLVVEPLGNQPVGNPVDDVGTPHEGDAAGHAGNEVGPQEDVTSPGLSRIHDGIQVLYTFEEAQGLTVRDTSGVLPPLDLTLDNANGTSWGAGNLSFEAASRAVSLEPTGRLADALMATSALTLEAWITPDNLQQDGPARIFTYSDGASARNVTLGQGLWDDQPKDTFNVRLRTTATSLDGKPLVTTAAGSADVNLQHVVYTRDALGDVRMYIDGTLATNASVGGDFSSWSDDFQLAIGNEIGAERPWLGSFHLLAVFDRALTPEEVLQNFQVGPGDATSGVLKVSPNSDVYFSGSEGSDVSGHLTTYHLTNPGTEALSWKASNASDWLVLSASGGVLQPGQSTPVVMTLDAGHVATLTPGLYPTNVLVEAVDGGIGTVSIGVELNIVPVGGGGSVDGVEMEFFEKSSGALDYMGVKITRTQSDQRLWAPGNPQQEYPGGWLTPGTYVIEVNGPRVHGKIDGKHTGLLRPEDQLVGVVVNKPLLWEGWENHDYTVHPDFELENWGQTKTVTLSPGDVVHVAYGSEVPISFGHRQGSDGILFYCVATEPEPRGGLWGLGHSDWSTELWDLLVKRIIESAAYMPDSGKDYTNWGPADGTLPATIPSDLGQKSGSPDNELGRAVGRWLMNRGVTLIKYGADAVDVEALDRLFRYWCNVIQFHGQYSLGVTAMNTMSHGVHMYPSYVAQDSVLPALVAAVALGYTPDYEPFYRVLSHLAQKPDMNMSRSGSYSHSNSGTDEDDLEAHKDENSYTKWLWYDVGAIDMKSKASHRMAVWGPCYWARVLLGYPQTPLQATMLSSVGPRFNNPDGSAGVWQGHEWSPSGAGQGWHYFYARISVQGAQWLWFSGVAEQSQFSRYARRHLYYPSGFGTFYGAWMADRFISEPTGLVGLASDEGVQLAWSGVEDDDFSHYTVFRGTAPSNVSPIASGIYGTGFTDTGAQVGTTYYYAVQAVGDHGHGGSISDITSVSF